MEEATDEEKAVNSADAQQPKTLKELMRAYMASFGEEADDECDRAMELYERIKALSPGELAKQAAIEEGEEYSVLHFAAKYNFPLDAITLLCDAIGIDTQDSNGDTAIMLAAQFIYRETLDLVNELANLKADLSLRNNENRNILIFNPATDSDYGRNDDREEVLEALTAHGVTSEDIPEGFRSTLHESAAPIPQPKRLAEEKARVRFYLRAMTLPLEQLEEEIKEYKDGSLLEIASLWGMEPAFKRIQGVWCDFVNARFNLDYGPRTLIASALEMTSAINISLFATMGADLSLKGYDGLSAFERWLPPREVDEDDNDDDIAMRDALVEHGITSTNIPPRFQSPLYFASSYYTSNVITQRWLNRSMLMMCLTRVYGWSLINQIEEEKYRTLPDDLSGIGWFVAHCWFDVAGSDNKIDEDKPDNGIARLIMSFAFGFDDSKSSFALIGMPEYGKVPETRIRCRKCRQHSKKELLQCCTDTHYCSKACKKAHRKSHKKSCDRNAYLARRAEEAARVA
jgi:ankyrin repeat protein